MRDGALDGLRGLAVLLVLASHASFAGHDLVPGVDLRGIGRAGVFLFFVLSSYLLTAQCLERGGGASWRWGRFALRRVLRILPAYALTMGLYVALGAFTAPVALQHLAFVRAEGHFWTIPIEALFYVTLPMLVLALSPVRGTVGRVALLVLLGLALRVAFPADYPSKAPEYRPNVAPFLPVFMVGSIVAVLRPRLEVLGGTPRAVLTTVGWAALLALVPLTPAVASVVAGAEVAPTRFHLWFDLFGVLFGCVVASTVPRAGGRTFVARVFSFAPLGWVGRISYSLYLLHRVAFDLVASQWQHLGLPHGWLGPASILSALAVGGAVYRLVERPFLGLLRANADAASGSDASDRQSSKAAH